MSIRNLHYLNAPASVAVIGGSAREGSLGAVVMANLSAGGFSGEIWPVNPKYREVMGRPCHAAVADLPAAPDMAVVVTPSATVPGIIGELGAKGCRLAVVITAGLTRDNGLRQAMLDAAKPYMLRVIGPNTLGILLPWAGINASFSHMNAPKGNLALLSQSGAIATAMIDWAAQENLGFSHVVSLGDMADVDVGDYLDLLAGDSRTAAVLMYLETIPAARKFMSAARAVARIKPVIAIKSGRHESAAKAAATHTGALSGSDRVAEAALERAGVLRVNDLSDLFGAAEILGRFRPLEAAGAAIVTNGGGAGVLATDRLADKGLKLAELDAATIATLDKALPATWSRSNPVDIIGDAGPQRFAAAIEAVAADRATGALLVLNCPTGLASAMDAARKVAGMAKKGTIAGKPVVTCWLGAQTAGPARAVLQDAGIACFDTPGDAARALGYLTDWTASQRQLMRVPDGHGSGDGKPEDGWRERIAAIFAAVAADGRTILTEPEAKQVLEATGIRTPKTIVAADPTQAGRIAAQLLEKGGEVAVKLVSRAITHKSDVGGVVLGLASAKEAEQAAIQIAERVARLRPGADIAGYSVQEMIRRPGAHETIVGVSRDPQFGPVMLFGAGGVSVEVVDDTAVALPPLDSVLAGDMIDRTRISRLLAGYRDRPPADRKAIVDTLLAVSDLLVEFPCIAGMDINPLLADEKGAIALDARIEIDPQRVGEKGNGRDFAIRPYPGGLETRENHGGRDFVLRPVMPADYRLYPEFLKLIDADDIRFRFLAPRRHFPDSMLLRLTQIDYDRDMAFVALEAEGGALAGISRLAGDPDREAAEFAILVRSDLQGMGLGWALLARLIEFARGEGYARIDGNVLAENRRMLDLCRDAGFSATPHPEERGVMLVSLKTADER
jgi:acetyltransferase